MRSTDGPPKVNFLLIIAAVFGLGIISGHGLFLSIFKHRCENLLDLQQLEHNQTVESLQQETVADNSACSSDEARLQEIFDLKGRLEAQSDLVASHRSLLDKHQISTARTQEIETELERKEAELFLIQKRIDLRNREKSELEDDLRDLKAHVEKELLEKSKTIETLESSIEGFRKTERDVLNHMASRHAIMCRQFFGRGPYYVEFVFDLPEQNSRLVVEVPTRKELPISVFTFLSLVESGFYNGMDLMIVGEGWLKIGASGRGNDADGDDTSMSEKLKSLGLGTLFFEETSEEHPCQDGSLSFDGPALMIHTAGHELQYGSCFGHIVRGKDDVLPFISESLQSESSLRMLSATVLIDDGGVSE